MSCPRRPCCPIPPALCQNSDLYDLDGSVRCFGMCCICDAIIDLLEAHADGFGDVHWLLHLFVIVDDVAW
eukprot:1028960-Ditylum_brightwellii.AAC.1